MNKEDMGLAPDQPGEINEEPITTRTHRVHVTWTETVVKQGTVEISLPARLSRSRVIALTRGEEPGELVKRCTRVEDVEIEDITILSVE